MLADGGGVKPVARLHVNQRFKLLPPVFGALHLPELPDPLRIALHEVGGVRLAAVGDHLNWRIGARACHVGGEIDRDDDQTANFSGLHFLDQFLPVVADGGIDVGRAGHGVGEVQRLFALLLQQNPDPQLAGVEVNPVAENKQQQQGDHHRNQPAAGVTHNLPRLFDAQGAHPAPGEGVTAHEYSPYPSRG